jgi:hypothetical protein
VRQTLPYMIKELANAAATGACAVICRIQVDIL